MTTDMDRIAEQEISTVIDKLNNVSGANPPTVSDNARHTELQALFEPTALLNKTQKSLMMDFQVLCGGILANNPTTSFLTNSVDAIKPKYVSSEEDEDCMI